MRRKEKKKKKQLFDEKTLSFRRTTPTVKAQITMTLTVEFNLLAWAGCLGRPVWPRTGNAELNLARPPVWHSTARLMDTNRHPAGRGH